MWLNVHPNDLGCNPPYELYYDTIEIKKEDLQNWIEYDTEQQYGVLNENSKRDN